MIVAASTYVNPMVYSGKPSAACERCRARRLRCDLAKPSCASCIRVNVQCVGYRDQGSFPFRDLSEATARKYTKQRARQHFDGSSEAASARPESANEPEVLPSIETPAVESNRSTVSTEAFSLSRSQTITPPIQEVARCCFYFNYVIGDSHKRHMSYLVPIVQDGRDQALEAAFNAVALAAFANIHSSPATTLKAHAEYAAALSETNRALRDPVLCKSDDVLAAVVLLGMFEIVACTDDRFVHRWINHLTGAAKLLEIRGSEQLSSPLGLQIFRQLRPQIIMGNMCQWKRETPILAQLTQQIEEEQPRTDQCILDDLAKLGIKVTRLCADVKDGVIFQPREIIREALKVDADLVSVVLGAEEPWRYQSVAAPTPPSLISTINSTIWGSFYHVYYSVIACTVWNNYRAIRIIVHELICDTIKQLNSTTDSDRESPQHARLLIQCEQTMVQMVEDICASVPFCFGCELNPEDADKASSDTGLSSAAAALPVNGSGGFTLMWPLLIAANSGVAPEDMRAWIAGCLDKIGHSMGINQALAMSGVLRKGMSVDAWLSPSREPPVSVC